MTASSTAPRDEVQAAGVWVTFRDTPPAARFVLLGVFINQFGAFLQAFLVLYLVHRGFTEGQAGLALGAYGVGAVGGVLLGGSLTDRLGPRATIVLSMLTSAVLVVTVSFLGYYPLIVAVVVAAGAMAQSYRPASAALLVGMTPPARQVMVMAMNRIALNLGTMIGPLVAAWLIEVSWNLIFWADGVTALAYGLIALALLPRQRPAGTEEAAQAAAEPGTEPARRVSYLTVLRDRPYVLFLFTMLTNALIFIQSMAVLPVAIRAEGYPTVVYSSVFAVGAGIVVCFELLVTKKVQYWPAARAASLGLVLLGVGLTGYGVGLTVGVPILLLAAVVGVVGQIIGGPTIFAWPMKVAPAGTEGRYLGLAHGMFGLGQAIGPVVGVLIYEQIGNGFWWLCGAVGLISAASAAGSMRQRVLDRARPLLAGTPSTPGTAVGELAEEELEPAAGPALPPGGPETEGDLDAVATGHADGQRTVQVAPAELAVTPTLPTGPREGH